jgi:phage host-nuclease inhibitor protein Gam
MKPSYTIHEVDGIMKASKQESDFRRFIRTKKNKRRTKRLTGE